MNTEEVRLAVPALPEYIRLARLTAAGLATRLGFTFDEVEDLRMAVDELCYLLVGPTGRPGTLTLTFALAAGALVVTGDGGSSARPAEFAELSEQILAAIVEEYEIAAPTGRVSFRMLHGRQRA